MEVIPVLVHFSTCFCNLNSLFLGVHAHVWPVFGWGDSAQPPACGLTGNDGIAGAEALWSAGTGS